MKNNFLLLVVALTLTGCVSTQEGMFLPANVQIGKPSFTIIKTVNGSATATYVLGLGGNKRHGLVKEAKEQMYSQHHFEENQMIANITLDEKKSWIFAPIVYKKTIIISADIIEFGVISEPSSKINHPPKKKNLASQDSKELTSDERIVKNLSSSVETELIEYGSINEVKIDDFVKVENPYNQDVYGKVVSIPTNKIVRIKLFPSPGTEVFDEISFKKLLKVKR